MIGKRIKEIRLARGLTQEELADAIGITSAMVSKYENGNSSPSYTTTAQICKELDITADYLIGVSDHKQPSRDSFALPFRFPEDREPDLMQYAHYLFYLDSTTSEQKELIAKLASLNKQQQKLVMDLIRSM